MTKQKPHMLIEQKKKKLFQRQIRKRSKIRERIKLCTKSAIRYKRKIMLDYVDLLTNEQIHHFFFKKALSITNVIVNEKQNVLKTVRSILKHSTTIEKDIPNFFSLAVNLAESKENKILDNISCMYKMVNTFRTHRLPLPLTRYRCNYDGTHFNKKYYQKTSKFFVRQIDSRGVILNTESVVCTHHRFGKTPVLKPVLIGGWSYRHSILKTLVLRLNSKQNSSRHVGYCVFLQDLKWIYNIYDTIANVIKLDSNVLNNIMSFVY